MVFYCHSPYWRRSAILNKRSEPGPVPIHEAISPVIDSGRGEQGHDIYKTSNLHT